MKAACRQGRLGLNRGMCVWGGGGGLGGVSRSPDGLFCATGVGAHQGQTSREGERDIWWTVGTTLGGAGHLDLTHTFVPPPPLAHARPCLSTGWALNRRFEEILGPLFLWSRMEDWVFVECLYRERGAHSCL